MSDETTDLPTIPLPAQPEPDSLFRYSTWLDVGTDAAVCDGRPDVDGNCTFDGHFHAWCRIPNDFQEKEIREHARAGAARKRRQMRNPETSAFEVLEEGIDQLRAAPDGVELARDELIGADWFGDYAAGVSEARDMDDEDATVEEGEDAPKLFADIDQDMARFQRLVAEKDVDSDEFKELQSHVARYQGEVEERVEKLLAPKRHRVDSMPLEDVLAELREKRIELAGQEEFLHHFSAHVWLSCTYRDRGGDPYFKDLQQLENAAPEVLRELRQTFSDLIQSAQRAAGN